MRTKEEVIKELNNLKIKENSEDEGSNSLPIMLIVFAVLALIFLGLK